MAQIVTITNPLTGQPAQVDQLEHTAQQIDDAIAQALPGGAIDIALHEKVNPNLLDNWYFANPVNQRGQTVYTSNALSSVHSIDRWMIWGQYTSSDTLSLNDGYVTYNSNGHQYGGITTQIESAGLRGETLTFSIFGRGGTTGRSVWVAVDSYDESDVQNRIASFYVTFDTIFSILQKSDIIVPSDSVTLKIQVLSSNNDGGIYDFKAAKLELGDQQTLAHQDADGNWVLNEIPDYGEQLARCQRYFQTFATESLRPTNALDFRPVMRATPALSTITVGGKTLYTASADL